MDLQIKIKRQVLSCRQTTVAGSVNFVTAFFNFDEEWDDVTSFLVVWINGDVRIETYLDPTAEIKSIVVPWEVLAEEGNLVISVTGTGPDDLLIPTKYMDTPVLVYQNGEMGVFGPMPPQPNAYDSIIEQCEHYTDERAVPPNWDENDVTSPYYVQNRPMYRTVEMVAPSIVANPSQDGMIVTNKLGLVIGQSYTFTLVDHDNNVTRQYTVECIADLPDQDTTIVGLGEPVLVVVGEVLGDYEIMLIDGINVEAMTLGNSFVASVNQYDPYDSAGHPISVYDVNFQTGIETVTGITPLPKIYSPVITKEIEFAYDTQCRIEGNNGNGDSYIEYNVKFPLMDSEGNLLYSNGPKISSTGMGYSLSHDQEVKLGFVSADYSGTAIKIPIEQLINNKLKALHRPFVVEQGLIWDFFTGMGTDRLYQYGYKVTVFYDTAAEAQAAYSEINVDSIQKMTLMVTDTAYFAEGVQPNE